MLASVFAPSVNTVIAPVRGLFYAWPTQPLIAANDDINRRASVFERLPIAIAGDFYRHIERPIGALLHALAFRPFPHRLELVRLIVRAVNCAETSLVAFIRQSETAPDASPSSVRKERSDSGETRCALNMAVD